ncbi:MAG TPA: alpha/beta hydrolase [Polyangiaceae bacterium]
MKTLYADAVRLKLETGSEVEAFVRTRSDGSKRPKCLLLHGNPGSLLDWEQVVPPLARAADIAAIDLPGFGRSPRGGPGVESLSLDRLAECAISVANALDWREPIYLVGHSHGGGVAQVAAARYPERVAGVALISTLGAPAHASYRLLSLPGAGALARFVGPLFRSRLLRPLNRAILRRVMSDIFSPEPVPAERLERELALFAARPEILLSMVQVTLGRPSRKLLRSASEIECRTLFLHGREDALVPGSCARAIHDRRLNTGKNSQFQLILAAGHMLIHYQATALVERIIADLLTEKLQGQGLSS